MRISQEEKRLQFRKDVYALLHPENVAAAESSAQSSMSRDAVRRALKAELDELFDPLSSD